MGKPIQRSNGTWRIREYSHSEVKRDKNGNVMLDKNGQPIKIQRYVSFTAPSAKEAKRLAAVWRAEKNKMSAAIPNISVGEAVDRYIASKAHVLSPSTVSEYKRSRKHDVPKIMDTMLPKLGIEFMQGEFDIALVTHSAKSVRNMLGLITPAIKMFHEDFPMHKIKLPVVQTTEFPLPSDDDVVTLIKYFMSTSEDMLIACCFAAFGSFRRSEISARVDSDIAGEGILVDTAMVKDENKKWVIKPPKTKHSHRFVIFPTFVMDLVKNKKGRLVNLNPDQITRRFIRARNNLSLPYFRFHDLRAYQASILHALGVPDKYIMERGGWSSTQTLNKVYKRAFAAKVSETDQLANNYFTSIFEKSN